MYVKVVGWVPDGDYYTPIYNNRHKNIWYQYTPVKTSSFLLFSIYIIYQVKVGVNPHAPRPPHRLRRDRRDDALPGYGALRALKGLRPDKQRGNLGNPHCETLSSGIPSPATGYSRSKRFTLHKGG